MLLVWHDFSKMGYTIIIFNIRHLNQYIKYGIWNQRKPNTFSGISKISFLESIVISLVKLIKLDFSLKIYSKISLKIGNRLCFYIEGFIQITGIATLYTYVHYAVIYKILNRIIVLKFNLKF